MDAKDLGAELQSHVSGLRRYARVLLGRSQADADELVQECLARALARAQRWHEIRDLRAYLFSILHNIYIDGINDQRRVADHRKAILHVDGASPPAQYSHLELRDLALALDKLSDDQRQVVLLVGLEGMSYQEVAHVLGVPIGTVMSRLSRGRDLLRALMSSGSPTRLRRVN